MRYALRRIRLSEDLMTTVLRCHFVAERHLMSCATSATSTTNLFQ